MKAYKSKKSGLEILRTYDELLKEWQLPYEESFIENDYGKTHVITCGKRDGEPVVLFHGVGDDSALMWIFNAAALGADYRLYAIDTIGGPGKSTAGPAYNKEFDDIKWLDTIFDALSLNTPHLIGTSHGGYLALRYLTVRPERTGKVIGISSCPSNGGKKSSMMTMMKIFFPEALFPTSKNVAKLLHKLSGKHAEVFTKNALIMEHYHWLLKGFNNMAMAYHKITGFTQEDLSLIRDRAFLLLGEMDPFETLGGEAFVKEQNLNARFYPDAGHGLNHEKADAVNSLILDILGGNIQDIR